MKHGIRWSVVLAVRVMLLVVSSGCGGYLSEGDADPDLCDVESDSGCELLPARGADGALSLVVVVVSEAVEPVTVKVTRGGGLIDATVLSAGAAETLRLPWQLADAGDDDGQRAASPSAYRLRADGPIAVIQLDDADDRRSDGVATTE